MVFSTNLRSCSFKQYISDIDAMLADQVNTYAILRYAFDIPTKTYSHAMSLLVSNIDYIYDRKLLRLVKEYMSISKVGIVDFDIEFDSTVGIDITSGLIVDNRTLFFDDEEDLEERVKWH